MKFFTYALLICLFSCSTLTPESQRKPANQNLEKKTIDEKLSSEIQTFQTMVEEMLVWRAKSLEFAQENTSKLKKERLEHKDIQAIQTSALEYVALRARFMEFAYKYQDVVENVVSVKYSPGNGTKIEKVNMPAESNGSIPSILNRIQIDPKDQEGEELLIKTKISLNAALVLYDSYMIGIYPYYKSKKMRKLLNSDIQGHRFEFDKITDSFFDAIKRNKMYQAIKLFNQDIEYKKAQDIALSNEENYLNLLALQSPFYVFMNTKYKPVVDPSALRVYFDRLYDRSIFMGDLFTFMTSNIFGNTVGLVAFRKGMLTKISSTEKKSIEKTLKPLDIMLEKTPFRLTDQFIPGHYGHVAIWIGTEEELKALGVWDHPSVAKYHEQIRSGHHIIEALRPGVQINSLEHFLNIDDLLVLRDQNLTDEQRSEYVIRAFNQIGKDYDFNFDVETDKKIVCSEIVYVVFHNINWPTDKALGRYTISPDNVASKVKDDTLVPVLMYTNGKKIEGNLKEEVEALLE